jgi:hypothetical protein
VTREEVAMLSELYRLVREEDGLEFLESAIVGGVAALAALHLWGRKSHFNAQLASLAKDVADRWFP